VTTATKPRLTFAERYDRFVPLLDRNEWIATRDEIVAFASEPDVVFTLTP